MAELSSEDVLGEKLTQSLYLENWEELPQRSSQESVFQWMVVLDGFVF